LGGSFPASGGGSVSGGGAADVVYQEAVRISNQRMPYVWGGGHARAGVPNGGGFDCSGYVVACLARANLGFRMGGGTATSGTLMGWGQAGFGRRFSVVANPGHTWIIFHNYPHKRADTSPWGCPPDRGPRVRTCPAPTGGYRIRHWPGL